MKKINPIANVNIEKIPTRICKYKMTYHKCHVRIHAQKQICYLIDEEIKVSKALNSFEFEFMKKMYYSEDYILKRLKFFIINTNFSYQTLLKFLESSDFEYKIVMQVVLIDKERFNNELEYFVDSFRNFLQTTYHAKPEPMTTALNVEKIKAKSSMSQSISKKYVNELDRYRDFTHYPTHLQERILKNLKLKRNYYA